MQGDYITRTCKNPEDTAAIIGFRTKIAPYLYYTVNEKEVI